MNGQYPVEIFPDLMTNGEPCYVATHPDLPGCVSWADTAGQARARLECARRAWVRSQQSMGRDVPPPSDRPNVTWTLGWGPDETQATW